MTCFGSQCPPPSKFEFIPQFYPGIPELQQYAVADEAEAAAKQKNEQIRASLQSSYDALQSSGNSDAAGKLKEILDDLAKIHNWVKSVNPPFVEAPMHIAYLRAAKLSAKIGAFFKEGQWQCIGTQPEPEQDGYYKCCPSGWVKLAFNSAEDCPDIDLFKCGPPPAGMDRGQLVCCKKQKTWVPASSTGDPCEVAYPTRPELILAPDIDISQRDEPILSPSVMIAGGLVAASLIMLTLLA